LDVQQQPFHWANAAAVSSLDVRGQTQQQPPHWMCGAKAPKLG